MEDGGRSRTHRPTVHASARHPEHPTGPVVLKRPLSRRPPRCTAPPHRVPRMKSHRMALRLLFVPFMISSLHLVMKEVTISETMESPRMCRMPSCCRLFCDRIEPMYRKGKGNNWSKMSKNVLSAVFTGIHFFRKKSEVPFEIGFDTRFPRTRIARMGSADHDHGRTRPTCRGVASRGARRGRPAVS